MARGSPPRISEDPKEERMVTWRVPGDIHRLLVRVTGSLHISHNRFITEIMVVKLKELERKLDAEQSKRKNK